MNNILLNSVVLFIFTYGKQTGQQNFIHRAITILESLPFEVNQVTAGFSKIGLRTGGAETSQALLQLKKSYCDAKRCLDCAIGTKLINKS